MAGLTKCSYPVVNIGTSVDNVVSKSWVFNLDRKALYKMRKEFGKNFVQKKGELATN